MNERPLNMLLSAGHDQLSSINIAVVWAKAKKSHLFSWKVHFLSAYSPVRNSSSLYSYIKRLWYTAKGLWNSSHNVCIWLLDLGCFFCHCGLVGNFWKPQLSRDYRKSWVGWKRSSWAEQFWAGRVRVATVCLEHEGSPLLVELGEDGDVPMQLLQSSGLKYCLWDLLCHIDSIISVARDLKGPTDPKEAWYSTLYLIHPCLWEGTAEEENGCRDPEKQKNRSTEEKWRFM